MGYIFPDSTPTPHSKDDVIAAAQELLVVSKEAYVYDSRVREAREKLLLVNALYVFDQEQAAPPRETGHSRRLIVPRDVLSNVRDLLQLARELSGDSAIAPRPGILSAIRNVVDRLAGVDLHNFEVPR